MSEDINFPDVNYGKANKDKMHELTVSEWSPFFGRSFWEIFIFSMSYAYAKKLEPKSVPGTGTMPPDAFQQSTRYLMRSLAISAKNDISIIKKSKDYVKICEEYAYAGFPEVYAQIKNNPTDKPVENILFNIISEIEKEVN